MKKILFVLLIIALVACAPKMYTCPDGSVVSDPDKCVAIAEQMAQDIQEETADMFEDIQEIEETTKDVNEDIIGGNGIKTLDPLAVELKEKAKDNQNYKFSFAEYPENKATRTYYVRGDLVKVELYSPALWKGSNYDVIYLDYDNERAVAYCLNDYHCKDVEGVVDRPDFDEYGITLPHQWMEYMDTAKALGGITVDNHAAERFKFQKDGVWYHFIVQEFFGIPQRVTWFTNEAMEGEPSGFEFRDLAINVNKEADVTPPDGW